MWEMLKIRAVLKRMRVAGHALLFSQITCVTGARRPLTVFVLNAQRTVKTRYIAATGESAYLLSALWPFDETISDMVVIRGWRIIRIAR